MCTNTNACLTDLKYLFLKPANIVAKKRNLVKLETQCGIQEANIEQQTIVPSNNIQITINAYIIYLV